MLSPGWIEGNMVSEIDGLRAHFLLVGEDHGCCKAGWDYSDWAGI